MIMLEQGGDHCWRLQLLEWIVFGCRCQRCHCARACVCQPYWCRHSGARVLRRLCIHKLKNRGTRIHHASCVLCTFRCLADSSHRKGLRFDASTKQLADYTPRPGYSTSGFKCSLYTHCSRFQLLCVHALRISYTIMTSMHPECVSGCKHHFIGH